MEGNYLGTIILGAIARRAIVQGSIIRGAIVQETIIWEAIILGGIVWGAIVLFHATCSFSDLLKLIESHKRISLAC